MTGIMLKQSTNGLFAAAAALVLMQAPPADAEPRSSWKLSCFAYRDVNRDGIFNMGDRPFGALPIRMTRPDGSNVVIRSNISGFANFPVKSGDTEAAAIYGPGDHVARSYPPAGWMLTSDNERQTVSMQQLDGAPGGLMAEAPCVHIGIAPILGFSGSFSAPENAALSDFVLSATHSDGREYDIPFDPEGNFKFAGYRGDWTLTFLDEKRNIEYRRTVRLVDAAVVFSHIDLGTEADNSDVAEANTVGFDDLVMTNSLFEIPSGYGGLNWNNWIATHNRLYKGAGYVNATVSSEYIAYNSSGLPAVVWSDEPFDFVGTYIGAAWPRGEEKDVVVKAWIGDDLVHEDRLSIYNAGPVYFLANYEGITRLEIVSEIWARIAIDNFSFRR